MNFMIVHSDCRCNCLDQIVEMPFVLPCGDLMGDFPPSPYLLTLPTFPRYKGGPDSTRDIGAQS